MATFQGPLPFHRGFSEPPAMVPFLGNLDARTPSVCTPGHRTVHHADWQGLSPEREATSPRSRQPSALQDCAPGHSHLCKPLTPTEGTPTPALSPAPEHVEHQPRGRPAIKPARVRGMEREQDAGAAFLPDAPSVRRRVYGPAESQEAVFADVCPLLTSFLDGFNVCIMAYGQTGSGKSYTMLGPHAEDQPRLPSGAHADLGIIPRVAEELFRLISESPPRSPTAEVSIVEIYNNDIFDLLTKEGSGAVVGVKRDVVTTQEGCTEVPGLICTAVASAAELVALVHGGLQLRARHPTLVHMASSRSHLVVTVTLTVVSPSDSTGELLLAPGQQHHPAPLQGHAGAGKGWSTSPQAPPLQPLPVDHTGSARQARAKLQLVDLAGSECAGASGVTGLALRETSFINRSLAALADVLGALSERRGHVPYRNSKLTHLLQDTIGGDAKLLVILCVSPGQKHVAETLQGLGFGARARQAERGQAGKRPSCAQEPSENCMTAASPETRCLQATSHEKPSEDSGTHGSPGGDDDTDDAGRPRPDRSTLDPQQPGKKRRRSGRAVPVGEREPKPRLPPPRLWVLCREGRPWALSPGTLAVPGSRGLWLGARLTP
ncbi:kinesin-like protein KIF25 [Callospermophilus lateralis]|uniref:kinesin-like protein KIF25 n=1 Tax=Callospermophilus lateralis TaxID=76772 RepID=UPI0040542609